MSIALQDDAAGSKVWEQRWENLGKNSFLKKNQDAYPEKWQAFYDQIPDLWEDMAGLSFAAAQRVAFELAGCGLVRAGKTILEIGCGPGCLAMALASQNCRITAMDLSLGMIRVLEKKISNAGIYNVKALAADWNRLDPAPDHDLVVASFFPEALCPKGVLRMESLAKQTCVLIMGEGRPAFPIYRQMWAKIMNPPGPSSTDHLTCAENYLKHTGRNPIVRCLSLPAVLDVSLSKARAYYTAYFNMLGSWGPHLDKAIDEVLQPYVKDSHIYLEGQSGAGVIYWSVPPG